MNQDFQATQNIVIDGVEHPLDKFSPQVKGMVGLRDVWVKQANEERAALTKTEAAIRQLDSELGEVIKAELEAQAKIDAEREAAVEAAKPTVKKVVRKKKE